MKFRTTFLIILLFISSSALCVPVGTGFSYQGELNDGGNPANGDFDFIFSLFHSETGGSLIISIPVYGVTVTNGIFTIQDIAFNSSYFDGQALWMEINVRTSPSGSYTTLTPRQIIQSVPYAVQAEYLSGTGASTNDILQFDGSDWIPSSAALSPWSKVGTKVSYTGGRVGIGTTNPNSTLHVSSTASDDPFRVQIGSATKFVVKNNGGMSIGVNAAPPNNGLYVHGDAKQDANSNGMIKYLVYAFCTDGTIGGAFTGPSLINRSVNNVNSDSISIANGVNDGECVITFPSNISSRFWQASVTGTDPNRGAHCTENTSTSLRCYGVKLSNGNREVVNLMLTVY